MSTNDITETMHIRATPEQAFAAWTVPMTLCRWFPETVVGRVELGAHVTFGWSSLGVEQELEIVELRAPSRVSFRGHVGPDVQTQTVQIDRVTTGVVVSVTHDGLPNQDAAMGTQGGWLRRLAILRQFLERHHSGQRTSFAVLGTAAVTPSSLFPHYQEPTWLCEPAPRLDRMGCQWTVRLGTSTYHGEVIAYSPPRELSVYCEEIEGVLSFDCLPAAGARLIGVEVTSWSEHADALRSFRQSLEQAVGRLVATFAPPETLQ